MLGEHGQFRQGTRQAARAGDPRSAAGADAGESIRGEKGARIYSASRCDADPLAAAQFEATLARDGKQSVGSGDRANRRATETTLCNPMAGWRRFGTRGGAIRKSGSRRHARISTTCPPAHPSRHYKPQLYNLHEDPRELVDVADKYPDVCQRYSAKLKEYLASGEGKTGGSFNAKPSLDLKEGLYAK